MQIEELVSKLSEKYGIKEEEIINQLRIANAMQSPEHKQVIVSNEPYNVVRTAMGPVVNESGRFYQIDFDVDDKWNKYMLLVKSELSVSEPYLPVFDRGKPVYLRIDSGCEPGQVFYDKMCDCKQQLELAIKNLGEAEQGLIVHIPGQDGRGKGTAFHLATLYLQEQLGVNTVESFTMMQPGQENPNLDSRTYYGAIAILKYLDLNDHEIIFGTNNPKKIEPLLENGFRVRRSAVEIDPTEYTRRHLEAKQEHLGHLLKIGG
jgi:3,4-dihydroxy 2-butanone 4-phosphate synthase/GTP cyclohydrolase II